MNHSGFFLCNKKSRRGTDGIVMSKQPIELFLKVNSNAKYIFFISRTNVSFFFEKNFFPQYLTFKTLKIIVLT
jgi:hypothetical protein